MLNDVEINALCNSEHPLLTPFFQNQVRTNNNSQPIIAYGSDAFSYDVMLSEKLSLFYNINTQIVDPKAFSEKCLVDAMIYEDTTGKYGIIPPNSYMLGHTIEYFNMPDNLYGVVLGKSTYARSGLIINPTLIKNSWSGNLVIEIANASTLPVKVYVNEGIASCVFIQGPTPKSHYNGPYQKQEGLTLPKM